MWFNKRYQGKSKFESIMINYDYRGHDFGNVFLVGEAAGLVSGFTGEGIHFAVKSGIDVSQKIIKGKCEYRGIRQILRTKKFHEFMFHSIGKNKKQANFIIENAHRLMKIKPLGQWILERAVY